MLTPSGAEEKLSNVVAGVEIPPGQPIQELWLVPAPVE